MPFRRIAALFSLALAFSLAATPVAPAWAQQLVGRIVASVNDDAITDYDVDARARLLTAASDAELTQQARVQLARTALRALIDDRLKIQEAERLGITVSDQEVSAAVQSIERNNRMEPGGLFKELTGKQVPVSGFIEQIKATLLWRKVLRRRVQPRVQVASGDVDDAMERLRKSGGGEILRAAEIYLPAASPADKAEALALARRLADEAQSDAVFARLAGRYSRSPTAAIGGDLGETAASDLEPEIAAELARLAPGQTGAPVETAKGVYVLRLIARRQAIAANAKEDIVTLARIFLTIDDTSDAAAQSANLRQAAAKSNDCDGLESAGADFGVPQPSRIIDTRMSDLPPQLREAVQNLQPNEKTGVLTLGAGVAVMMLCSRSQTADAMPSETAVADAIQQQRMQRQAERYLRDLRRVAFIDIRG